MYQFCPFCDLPFSSSELQRHANSHFQEEEEETPNITGFDSTQFMQNGIAGDWQFEQGFERGSNSNPYSNSIGEKVQTLLNLQRRSGFHRIEGGGLIALLKECLESEPENSITILSGHVDHFQSSRSEDDGWGCGYRNIQILCSNLLSQSRDSREALFCGSGFVPDIPSLQRWLEIAWERGFDRPGSAQLDNQVYGTKKWIGATECVTLLRSFGVRAMVADFGPREFESLYLSVPGSKRKTIPEICGPMDRFVRVKKQETGSCSNSSANDCRSSRENKGRKALIDWIWNYFSGNRAIDIGGRRVILSNKAPLYFQHDGHSRTIIGIQVKNQHRGMPQYTLLILDPGLRTIALEKALKEKRGWQKFIKRGVHTLKKPQYQLCYVEPGISSKDEMESMKTINSTFFVI